MQGDNLAAQFREGFAAEVPAPLGLAVSGGGDSIAMLYLAVRLGVPIHAVTVDHGLRTEAKAEASFVAQTCARLGVPHDTLRWQGWNGQGNLQAAARSARYDLIAAWAQKHDLAAVAVAHTMEDLAETFVMRLARGSGVDGLSAMRTMFRHKGQMFVRPMLSMRRSALRDFLNAQGQTWVEDPSNEDDRFDRVKTRKALMALAPLGLDVPKLARTAQQMTRARSALTTQAAEFVLQNCRDVAGSVVIGAQKLQNLPEETRLRVLSAAVCHVSGAEYRPRLEALTEAADLVLRGKTRSLSGCLVTLADGQVLVMRELKAIADLVCSAGETWDRRWQLTGAGTPDMMIAALGQTGLRQCPDWRETGLPPAALLSSPAIWQGDTLIAAPLANFSNGWQAQLIAGRAKLIEYLESH